MCRVQPSTVFFNACVGDGDSGGNGGNQALMLVTDMEVVMMEEFYWELGVKFFQGW